jgi:hypothetical protein
VDGKETALDGPLRAEVPQFRMPNIAAVIEGTTVRPWEYFVSSLGVCKAARSLLRSKWSRSVNSGGLRRNAVAYWKKYSSTTTVSGSYLWAMSVLSANHKKSGSIPFSGYFT